MNGLHMLGRDIKAVIFDLDGVIVSTDEFHYLAWKRIADENGIYFDREINHRLRGVSRAESLEIILERAERKFAERERLDMAERKNGLYREMIKTLTPKDRLDGVDGILSFLKEREVKTAIGSSSKNARDILGYIGLSDAFDAIADGHDIRRTKPDPEVFLIAAERLGVEPRECLVVEDARAGVEAAINAGMAVIGIGTGGFDYGFYRHAGSVGELYGFLSEAR